MNILFVDTETGGLNPFKHSLLEVGLVAQVNGHQTGVLQFYVKHDSYEITEKAMQVNKLNIDDVNNEGIDTKEAAEKMKTFVLEHFGNEKPVLCGHNPSIDKYMIRQQIFSANGLEMDDLISHRMIDTMSIIWALHLAGALPYEACSSSGAFEYFGISIRERHKALDDCLATAELLLKLIERVRVGQI